MLKGRILVSILLMAILMVNIPIGFAYTKDISEKIVTETVVISEPELIEDKNYISINLLEANSNYYNTDKPLLPVITEVFTFEVGSKIGSVDVEFSDIKVRKLSKPVEPSPEICKISSINVKNNVKNEVISYEGLGIYPKEKFSYKTATGKNGKDHALFCSVSLNPIQYDPDENQITCFQKAEINIKYEPPKNPIVFPDEYELLILTPEEFESALQRLLNHKNERDIKTKLVTLDEIPSQGIDEQESIKLYIKDAIETWGVDYLILVGSGVVGEAKFPFRYAWIKDNYEDFFPSDLYFADIYDSNMDFSDWDIDDDGKYAEYPDDTEYLDILPDIFLGRIPCDTVSELNAYIDKVIWYDEHNKMTNKILLVGGDTVTFDGGVFEGEYANEAVLSKLPGYKGTKLWGSNGKITKINIALGFKSYPDFVDFSGHGTYRSWATHPPFDEDYWVPINTSISDKTGWRNNDFEIYAVKSPTKYPIVFYCACSNNKFTKSKETLSWKTISYTEGGGIIAFGASGIGYMSMGEMITERVMGWMEVHTFDELYKTKNLGQVWSNCVKDYFTTFEGSFSKNDYKTMLELSMFGDPTLSAQEGDDPQINQKSSQFPRLIDLILNHFPLLRFILRQI